MAYCVYDDQFKQKCDFCSGFGMKMKVTVIKSVFLC